MHGIVDPKKKWYLQLSCLALITKGEASKFVLPLGKALNEMSSTSCGRQVVELDSAHCGRLNCNGPVKGLGNMPVLRFLRSCLPQCLNNICEVVQKIMRLFL